MHDRRQRSIAKSHKKLVEGTRVDRNISGGLERPHSGQNVSNLRTNTLK